MSCAGSVPAHKFMIDAAAISIREAWKSKRKQNAEEIHKEVKKAHEESTLNKYSAWTLYLESLSKWTAVKPEEWKPENIGSVPIDEETYKRLVELGREEERSLEAKRKS